MTSRNNPDLNKTSRSTKERTYRFGKRKGQPKAHPRLRQRAAEVRRRPWRVVGVLALILALVAGVVFLFGFSTVFEVEEVTVAGAKGDIADDAQVVGDTQLGRPLARVDAQALEERVLEDTRVASVEISRNWPSGLTLDLTLRKPTLAIDQSGTPGIQLVDSEGTVFNTIKDKPKGVPLARVRIQDEDLDPDDLVALQELRDALPEAVAKETGDLTLTRTGDIEFTVGAIEVVWGDGSNAQLKGRVLQGLLEQEGLDPEAEVPAAGPMTIDVTIPTTPVVTGLTPEDEG
ncbi:cell division protein FtsQ/DivIB [Ornithinimicrobium murale]|uniref:cell division protein FtsQ/DivIB n=1 Tax=Ornithinimicrobium murale TaxID=1050153 RepID=UPI000E0CBFB2|nr:FtsQ-type POTRA domain-containing protein [Ornithinimicrobium murale]